MTATLRVALMMLLSQKRVTAHLAARTAGL
jgi:hypothetical protein